MEIRTISLVIYVRKRTYILTMSYKTDSADDGRLVQRIYKVLVKWDVILLAEILQGREGVGCLLVVST